MSSSERRQGRVTVQRAIKAILGNLFSSASLLLTHESGVTVNCGTQHNRYSHEAETQFLSLSHTPTHTGGLRGTAALPVTVRTVCHIFKAWTLFDKVSNSTQTHMHSNRVSHSGLKSLCPLPPSYTCAATRCIFRNTGSGSVVLADSVDVMANNMSNNSVS